MSDLQQAPPAVPSSDATSAFSPERDEARGTDALAHLAKMSGTGSTFGAADYVAINPVAVASLIIGFAGALALLISVFLFLPVIGIGCGLVAIRQIRRSNGTQGGYLFAVAGIVVALIMGGLVAGREVQDWMTTKSETRAVGDVISTFGQKLRAGDYDTAYDGLTTEDFRNRIDRATFRKAFEELQRIPGYGPIESMEYNHEGMLFETTPLEKRATCLTSIRCRDMKDAGREFFRVTNKDGPWRITSISHLFPEKKPTTGFPKGS